MVELLPESLVIVELLLESLQSQSSPVIVELLAVVLLLKHESQPSLVMVELLLESLQSQSSPVIVELLLEALQSQSSPVIVELLVMSGREDTVLLLESQQLSVEQSQVVELALWQEQVSTSGTEPYGQVPSDPKGTKGTLGLP